MMLACADRFRQLHERDMREEMSGGKPSGGRGARFAGAMDPAAAALNASVHFDRRLLRDDVRGSQAHARMLAAAKLISAADAEAIVDGLDQVAEEIASGKRALDPALEDIHMNVESRLTEIIGEPARRLHTARSRNDQVATDLRLYARRAALEIVRRIDRARLALCRQARAHAATLLPGYTHLQRAQVVTLGHHLLAYAEMLGRDRGRFVDAERRAGESPLGSGALAGTGLPIDRAHTAARAGVRRRSDAQQPGRRLRSRLRRRDRLRGGAAGGAPVAPGRGAGALVDDRVRVRAARRGLLLGQLADAAEAQPRHRRAPARQVGAGDRRPGRAADDQQGADARLQQRSAGDAGAALRRGRDGAAIAGGAARA